MSLVRIKNAVFKDNSKYLFHKNPLSFEIKPAERWAILGDHKTQFLKVLAGKYISAKVQYAPRTEFINFGYTKPKQHISARYEYFKEDTDDTVLRYVTNHQVNVNHSYDQLVVKSVLQKLQLESLKDNYTIGLSNGQMRRAVFAKALIKKPYMLVVDEPFLGLDPGATKLIASTLKSLPPDPYVVIGLRNQDWIPEWITHVVIVGENGIEKSGKRGSVEIPVPVESGSQTDNSKLIIEKLFNRIASAHICFNDVSVTYRGKKILEKLSFDVQHGEKFHIQGNNGTGKTTVLSLIMADHPQSWNKNIIINNEPRKVGKHNYFDINRNIGFSSPEMHAIVPKDITVWDLISSGFELNMIAPKNLSKDQRSKVGFLVDQFQINKDAQFQTLSISDQKVALFLRAIVKGPELLVLDEALSCMEEPYIQKCKQLIESWPGTVLVIGHVANEVPQCSRYLRLKGVGDYEVGRCSQP